MAMEKYHVRYEVWDPDGTRHTDNGYIDAKDRFEAVKKFAIKSKANYLDAVFVTNWMEELDEKGLDYYMTGDKARYDVWDLLCAAWVCTLFGYDIGTERAMAIDNYLYETTGDHVLVYTEKDAEVFKLICRALGYNDIRFDDWAKETPEEVGYDWWEVE